MMITKMTKKPSRKVVTDTVANEGDWVVKFGELKRGRGRPNATSHLFQFVGEKIPYAALDKVQKHHASRGERKQGVYIAHDSMGTARYIGRGDVFSRLRKHKKSHEHELVYFSFFIVENRQHEREIETLLIRAAGPQLEFNDRKKRIGIAPGAVRDFEPGTRFYQRQKKKGKKVSAGKRSTRPRS